MALQVADAAVADVAVVGVPMVHRRMRINSMTKLPRKTSSPIPMLKRRRVATKKRVAALSAVAVGVAPAKRVKAMTPTSTTPTPWFECVNPVARTKTSRVQLG